MILLYYSFAKISIEITMFYVSIIILFFHKRLFQEKQGMIKEPVKNQPLEYSAYIKLYNIQYKRILTKT